MTYPGEYWWHWGLHAALDIGGGGTPIVITDYPGPGDPADCLGYHSVDGNYQPYAVIFAALTRDHCKPPTAVISHELLEMLADQSTSTVNLIDLGDGTGVIVDQEVCDPCESLYYEGPAGGLLSDFALPGWWLPGYQGTVDFLGLLQGPLRDASGGYFPCQTVIFTGGQQSGDADAQQSSGADAQQSRGPDAAGVIDRAARALRAEADAAFSARAGVVDQLRARWVGTRLQHPPPTAGTAGGRPGPAALERRKQPARRAGPGTVIRRESIATFVRGPRS